MAIPRASTHHGRNRRRFVDPRKAEHFDFEGGRREVWISTAKRSLLREIFASAGVPMPDHPDQSYLAKAGLMCLVCSHTSHASGSRDPVTGLCRARKACDQRRSELDDETIEYLGLIPR